MFLISILSLQLFAEPVLIPSPEIRGAATKAHVNDFFIVLLQELSTDKSITVRRVSDLDPIRGEEAQKYMSECIPGEVAGCAFSLADANGLPLLLSTKFESNKEVTVTIVRIANGSMVQEAIRGSSTDELAQNTVLLYTQVQNGTYTAPKPEGEEEQRQVEQQNDDEDVLDYKDYKLPPILLKSEKKEDVRLTKTTIEEMKKDEGSKEWDKYNMAPEEYMRFINSGLSLMRWKDLKQGRKNKFMVRIGGGLGFLPAHALYYGRSVYSDVDTTLVEAYAWQIPQTEVSVVSQVSLSYGLTPEFDLGVSIGRATGRISMDLWSQKAGQTPYFRKDDLTNPVFLFDPEISFVPKITSVIRPIASVGMSFLFGRSTEPDVQTFTRTFGCRYYPQYDENNQCITTGLFEPTVDTPFIASLKIQPGIEMSLNRHLDVWIRTPLSYVLFSNHSPDVIQEGGGALPERERDLPGGYSTIGFGVIFGVQTRIDPVGISKSIFNRD